MGNMVSQVKVSLLLLLGLTTVVLADNRFNNVAPSAPAYEDLKQDMPEPSAPELSLGQQEYYSDEYVCYVNDELASVQSLGARPPATNPASRPHLLATHEQEKDVRGSYTLKPEDITRAILKTDYEARAAKDQLKMFLDNGQGEHAAALYIKTFRTNSRRYKEDALYEVIAQYRGRPIIDTMITYFEKHDELSALREFYDMSVVANNKIEASKAQQAAERVKQKEAQKRIKQGALARFVAFFVGE
jgi:folylpolyglutamate synthase/dihydropteroate synthase